MAHRKGDARVLCEIKRTSPRGTLTTPPSNPEAGGVTLPPSDVLEKEGQPLQSTALEKPRTGLPHKLSLNQGPSESSRNHAYSNISVYTVSPRAPRLWDWARRPCSAG